MCTINSLFFFFFVRSEKSAKIKPQKRKMPQSDNAVSPSPTPYDFTVEKASIHSHLSKSAIKLENVIHVWDIPILGSTNVPTHLLQHVARVFAGFMDTNSDGCPDDLNVFDFLKSKHIMPTGRPCASIEIPECNHDERSCRLYHFDYLEDDDATDDWHHAYDANERENEKCYRKAEKLRNVGSSRRSCRRRACSNRRRAFSSENNYSIDGGKSFKLYGV